MASVLSLPLNQNAVKTEALEYARKGFRVLPLHTPTEDGCSCRKDCGRFVGKHPRTWHGLKDASLDEMTINKWWSRWPQSNIGIAVPHSYVVFDVDTRTGGSLDALGRIPDTVRARTGNGWHVWFQLPVHQEIAGTSGMPGIDIRKHGNYVVAAPSLHQCGHHYTWESSLLKMSPALIPPHLQADILLPMKMETVPPRMGERLTTNDFGKQEPQYYLLQALQNAHEGNRRRKCFLLSQQLRDTGVSQEDAVPTILEYVSRVSQTGHPFTESQGLSVLRSTYNYPRRPYTHHHHIQSGAEIGGKKYQECVEAAVAADSTLQKSERHGRGRPANVVTRQQFSTAKEVWRNLLPEMTMIQDNKLREWWPWIRKVAPGHECEWFVRQLLKVYSRIKDGPVGYMKEVIHDKTGMPNRTRYSLNKTKDYMKERIA